MKMIKSTNESKDLKSLIHLDTNGVSGDKSDFRHKNETIIEETLNISLYRTLTPKSNPIYNFKRAKPV
jgi:hypothetical protein